MSFGITFPLFTTTDREVGWNWVPGGQANLVVSSATAVNIGSPPSAVSVRNPGSWWKNQGDLGSVIYSMVVVNGIYPNRVGFVAKFISLP